MVSSLGNHAVQSCAAARAGLSMAEELTNLDFSGEAMFGVESREGPPTIHGHVVRDIGEGFAGVGKSLVHGAAALDDLLRQRPVADRDHARTGMILHIADASVEDFWAKRAGQSAAPSVRWRELTNELPQRLAESRGLTLAPSHVALHRGGNAGGAAALGDAVARIQKGEIDRCIVGGLDARTEAGFLKAAAQLFQLRTTDNPVGLSPGEAAAFYLVERENDIRHSGRAPLARVSGAWVGRDKSHLLEEDSMPDGVVLAELLRGALAHLGGPSGRGCWVIGDLNGTSRRAQEWSNARVRLSVTHTIDAADQWFPATSFGDTGAASAAVAVCCIARAFQRGYSIGRQPRDAAITWSSSESGAKGVLALQRP